MDILVREITNDIWEKWGIQAFEWGGDITLIGKHGTISQIPEFHEDEFHFELEVTYDFEVQYIVYHERADSMLLQLFTASQ